MSRSFMQGFADELQKVAQEPMQQPLNVQSPPMARTPGVRAGVLGSPGSAGNYRRPAFQPLNAPNLLPGNPYAGLTKEQMQQPKLNLPKAESEHIQSGQDTAKRLAAESAASGRLLPGPAKTTGHASSKTRPGTAKKVVAKEEETPKSPFPSANVRPETPETQKVKFSEQSGIPSWASPPKGHKPTGKEYWEGGHTEEESTPAPTTSVKPSSAPVTAAVPTPAPTPAPESTATQPATTGQEKPWSVSDIPGSHLAEPEVQRTVAAAKSERESAAKTGNWFKSGLF